MLDDPIRQRAFEADVFASLFRFDPFVSHYLVALGLKFTIERRVSEQIVCRECWFYVVGHNWDSQKAFVHFLPGFQPIDKSNLEADFTPIKIAKSFNLRHRTFIRGPASGPGLLPEKPALERFRGRKPLPGPPCLHPREFR